MTPQEIKILALKKEVARLKRKLKAFEGMQFQPRRPFKIKRKKKYVLEEPVIQDQINRRNFDQLRDVFIHARGGRAVVVAPEPEDVIFEPFGDVEPPAR